ncbi:hypothetical protein AB0L57_18350 [Nocardia sp. NPDC052254]|uniref:hypothetical protein n=1 Tax=Nocardia sp. NPDC052254 TaxID=3155681 RepID=UPI00341E9A7A
MMLGLVAVALAVAWPFLLGTWIAVQFGAANPSTARSVVGWVLEVPWLVFLALLLVGVLMGERSPKAVAQKGDRRSAASAVSAQAGGRYVRLPSDYQRPSSPLWLDGSAVWTTSTGWDNNEVLLAAAAGRPEVEVEAVPEPGNPHDSTAIALDIHGQRVGYLYRGVSGDLCRVIQQLNASGYRVLLHGRVSLRRAQPTLEVRGSWPGDIMAWLKLPVTERDSYFELDWQKADYTSFYQSKLAIAMGSATDLIADCQFRAGNRAVDPYSGVRVGPAGPPAMPKEGTYVDVYLGEAHVGEVRAERILESTDFGMRVGSGQLDGFAKLRRWNDDIELQVVARDLHGTFPRKTAPFLWSDEREAELRQRLDRASKAREAEMVDGVRLSACRQKLAELKRAGDLESARVLATKMVDAARASAAIATRRPQSWVTIEAAIVLRKMGEVQAEIDILDDYVRSCSPYGPPEEKVLHRLSKANHLLGVTKK